MGRLEDILKAAFAALAIGFSAKSADADIFTYIDKKGKEAEVEGEIERETPATIVVSYRKDGASYSVDIPRKDLVKVVDKPYFRDKRYFRPVEGLTEEKADELDLLLWITLKQLRKEKNEQARAELLKKFVGLREQRGWIPECRQSYIDSETEKLEKVIETSQNPEELLKAHMKLRDFHILQDRANDADRETAVIMELAGRVEGSRRDAEQSVAQKKTAVRASIQEGSVGQYYTLDEVLNKDNFEWDKLPQLTIDELRLITMYPKLSIGQIQGARFVFDIGTESGGAEISPVQKFRNFELKKVRTGSYVMQTGDGFIPPGVYCIKHPTNERVNGRNLPKDLILAESPRRLAGMKKHLSQMYASFDFPRLEEQVVGWYEHDRTRYLVIDSHLMFIGKLGTEGLREYYCLRGRDEQYAKRFNEQKRIFQKTPARLGGRNFFLIYSDAQELRELSRLLPQMENATGNAGQEYADMTAVNPSSPTLNKLMENKNGLGEIIRTLDQFFRGKANHIEIPSAPESLEKTVQRKFFDCEFGSKVAANAFRMKGFAANAVRGSKGRIVEIPLGVDHRSHKGHIWTEVYLPKMDVVIVFDVNNPQRNYIFKPDRQKMDYEFDSYGENGVYEGNDESWFGF